jgi:hypothetical protein
VSSLGSRGPDVGVTLYDLTLYGSTLSTARTSTQPGKLRIQALAVEQINQALRRHVDWLMVTIVKAGVYQ